MFRFEISNILWFLALLPLLLIWFAYQLRRKKRLLQQSGEYTTITRLFADWSVRKSWLKTCLIISAMACMLIAWANPQWGSRTETVKVKSSDIVIALDISESMLAEDISPNRMERAKFMLSELLKKFRGDRVGLVYFAGSAYLQMPLSNDFATAETYIKSANPNQAGTQGTVIADAIDLAVTIFGEDSPTQKALIIISDGENHESEAIEAARKATENGIYTFTLGIGTEEGANIPLKKNGQIYLKTDKTGQVIKSAINIENLKNIAEAGEGKFFSINGNANALDQLDAEINKLEKRQVEQKSFTDYNSYFQAFIFLAILLLIIDMLLSKHKGTSDVFKKLVS